MTNMNLIYSLLKYVTLEEPEIRELMNKDDEALERFETTYFYKDCFQTAHDINLKSLKNICSVKLGVFHKKKCVGCILAVSPHKIGMQHIIQEDGLLITNLCVQSSYRSVKLGEKLLHQCILDIISQNQKPLISINTREPLNNAKKLYDFYTKNGFTHCRTVDNLIVMRYM